MPLPQYVLDQQQAEREKFARDLAERSWRQNQADSRARAQHRRESQSVDNTRSTSKNGSGCFGILILVLLAWNGISHRSGKPAAVLAKGNKPLQAQKGHRLHKGSHAKHTLSANGSRMHRSPQKLMTS